MKKPERIIGFVNYDNYDFPFEFDEKDFVIVLYPPTKEIWSDYSSPRRLLDSLIQDNHSHEWIPQSDLKGNTSDGNNIMFNVQEAFSNYHGFISFDVNWYVYYADALSIDKIDGFRILGNDVNLFFPPQIVLDSKIEFKTDTHSIAKISVSSREPHHVSCGKYQISENIDAIVDVNAYASYHNNTNTNPIDAVSSMITSFSIPVGVDTIIGAYFNVLHFFEYITYRKNVHIGNLDLFFINDEGLRDYSGIIVFPCNYKYESHSKVKERIITYSLLDCKSADLFKAINNDRLVFQHLCKSIDKTRHYPASRIIMIFAAFEREYRNIYGKDFGRSDEYLEAKQKVVSLIDDFSNTFQGKKKKYIDQLKKYVDLRDNSFEDSVKRALSDCEDILSPFVLRRYSGDYLNIIDDISSRMGAIRNGIAHSKLDLTFDAIHLSDIHIIELLLYALRLKKISLSTLNCKKAINQLFGENFHIESK